jgi:hypothetical protein
MLSGVGLGSYPCSEVVVCPLRIIYRVEWACTLNMRVCEYCTDYLKEKYPPGPGS